MKKEDLRVRKTKANLYKALIQVMEQKSFEEIKVTDICKVSSINRSTFYDHFNDKYELLASFLKFIKDELTEKILSNKEIVNIKEYYIELIKLIFEYQKKYNNIFSANTIFNNNNSVAYDMFQDAMLDAVTEHLQTKYNNNSIVPTEIISKFYVSAVISICLEVINSKEKYNPEDLYLYLNVLIPEQKLFTEKESSN